MFRQVVSVLLFVAALAVAAGCQANPRSWQGGVKFLSVHSVAFTAQGRGLIIVGPRPGGDVNSTAYYHLDLQTLYGRRLGYGQYSLGESLISPYNDWVAVPTYFAPERGGAPRPGYQICDTRTGEVVRRAQVDGPDLFVPHRPTSRPDLVRVWTKIAPNPLTGIQQKQIRTFLPAWLTRGGPGPATTRAETVDGQVFRVLDSPDQRHRLFMRFCAPGGTKKKAANPDGEGYAYGFLRDSNTGKRYKLFTTGAGDERLDAIGSGIVGGPAWLIKQPAKAFGK